MNSKGIEKHHFSFCERNTVLLPIGFCFSGIVLKGHTYIVCLADCLVKIYLVILSPFVPMSCLILLDSVPLRQHFYRILVKNLRSLVISISLVQVHTPSLKQINRGNNFHLKYAVWELLLKQNLRL